MHVANTHLTAPRLTGDYNQNGVVDAPIMWCGAEALGTTYTQNDYDVWRAHFGQTAGSGAARPSAEPLSAAVPEPATLLLLLVRALEAYFVDARGASARRSSYVALE